MLKTITHWDRTKFQFSINAVGLLIIFIGIKLSEVGAAALPAPMLALVVLLVSKWPRYLINNYAWAKRFIFIYAPLFLLFCFSLKQLVPAVVLKMTGLDVEIANLFMIPFFKRSAVAIAALFVCGAWWINGQKVVRQSYPIKDEILTTSESK